MSVVLELSLPLAPANLQHPDPRPLEDGSYPPPPRVWQRASSPFLFSASTAIDIAAVGLVLSRVNGRLSRGGVNTTRASIPSDGDRSQGT